MTSPNNKPVRGYSGTPDWLQRSLIQKAAIEKDCALYDRVYNDKVDERFASPIMRERIRRNDRAGYYTLNLARSAVDAPMERTKISGIICEDQKARDTLLDFWKNNELEFESTVAHEKAYEFGHAVAVLMPNDKGQLEAYVHSPEDFTVFYDPRRPRVKSHAIHTYLRSGDADSDPFGFDQSLYYIVEVYTPLGMQRWRSTTALATGVSVDVSTVDMILEEEVDNVIVGELPVFHFRTARTPTGRSRLADVVNPQQAFNDVLTGMMASIKEAAYRQRWQTSSPTAKGKPDLLSSNPEDGTGVLENEFEASPSTILQFEGNDVKLGSFDVTQSDNYLKPLDAIAGYMSKVSDVPTHYYTTGAQAPSGESYRQGERPLRAVVEHCTGLFAATWSEMFKYVLKFYGVAEVDATVDWKPISTDDKDYWETQEIQVGLGKPAEVAFVESGRDQETVDGWFAKDGEEENPETSVVDTPANDDDLIPPGTTPDLDL